MNNRIKELRKTLKLTQKEFGAKLGLSDSAVTVWERGGKVSKEKIPFICQTFRVNQSWLENGEGEMFEGFAPKDSSPESLTVSPYEYALQQGFSARMSELFARLCELSSEEKKSLGGLIAKVISPSPSWRSDNSEGRGE